MRMHTQHVVTLRLRAAQGSAATGVAGRGAGSACGDGTAGEGQVWGRHGVGDHPTAKASELVANTYLIRWARCPGVGVGEGIGEARVVVRTLCLA